MSLELLKFEAEYCQPCKQQSELLSSFDAIPVRVIDVDEEQAVANEYNIRGIPTLILEKDGEALERWTGVTQPSELEEAVSRYS